MTSNYSLNSPGPSVCSTNRDKTTTPNNNINTIDAITNNVIYPPLSIYTLNASQDMLLGNLSSTIEQYNKQYKRRYELLQKEEDLWVELLRNGIKRRKNSGISLSIPFKNIDSMLSTSSLSQYGNNDNDNDYDYDYENRYRSSNSAMNSSYNNNNKSAHHIRFSSFNTWRLGPPSMSMNRSCGVYD